jgi:hypothetical protein
MTTQSIHSRVTLCAASFETVEAQFHRKAHYQPSNRFIEIQFINHLESQKIAEEIRGLEKSRVYFSDLKKEIKEQKKSYKTLASEVNESSLDKQTLNSFGTLMDKIFFLESKIKVQCAETSIRLNLLKTKKAADVTKTAIEEEESEGKTDLKSYAPDWLKLGEKEQEHSASFYRRILNWFEQEIPSGKEVILKDAHNKETALHRNGLWIVIHTSESAESKCIALIKKAIENDPEKKWKFSYQLPNKEGDNFINAEDLLKHFPNK